MFFSELGNQNKLREDKGALRESLILIDTMIERAASIGMIVVGVYYTGFFGWARRILIKFAINHLRRLTRLMFLKF